MCWWALIMARMFTFHRCKARGNLVPDPGLISEAVLVRQQTFPLCWGDVYHNFSGGGLLTWSSEPCLHFPSFSVISFMSALINLHLCFTPGGKKGSERSAIFLLAANVSQRMDLSQDKKKQNKNTLFKAIFPLACLCSIVLRG